MDAENKIENIKIELTLKNDFNTEDIFRIFENNKKGYLDINDLKKGFNLLNVNINYLDISLLINRFDLNKKGYINFADFFDMIVPYETEYRNLVENRIPNSCCPCIVPDILSFSTKNLLKNLFEMLIDYENKFNCMKRGYNMLIKKLKNIFNEIDSNCLGFFNNDDFNYYLIKNNLFRSIKQSNLLYIRLDKNRDGKIDYNEMENEFKC
jgi:Ca2+-binding EF-hand superfamily protein